MKAISAWVLFAVLVHSVAFVEWAHAATPSSTTASAMTDVQQTLDRVVAIVQEFPGTDNTVTRRAKMREVIQPRFDFDEMAKRSLGSHWPQVSEADQKEFVSVFSELLATTYLSKIETVKENMVKVDSEKLDFPKSLVKTTVTSKGDSFPIDYRLQNVDGAWRVYDVIIENIGLVANYRNEFAGIIRREKFAGLMDRLRKKATS